MKKKIYHLYVDTRQMSNNFYLNETFLSRKMYSVYGRLRIFIIKGLFFIRLDYLFTHFMIIFLTKGLSSVFLFFIWHMFEIN